MLRAEKVHGAPCADRWRGYGVDMQHDMTYSESAEGVTITVERAVRELSSHGCVDVDDVWACLTETPRNADGSYNAGDILRWLGY